MSDKLADFLTSIATDDKLRKKFAQDADKTMKKAGLTSDEIELVKNQDHNGIAKKLGNGYSFTANSVNGVIDVFKIDK